MAFEIVAVSKQLKTEEDVREALAQARPEWTVTNVENRGEIGWLARLEDKVADVPPFLKKEEEGAPSDDAPSDDAPSDDDAPKGDDEKSDDKKKDDSPGELDSEEKGDLVKQLEGLVEQVTTVLEDLKGKASEVAEDAKAKDETIKGIHDQVKDLGGGSEEMPLPMDGPPMDAPMPGDTGPVPGKPMAPPKRPGAPTGKSPRGGRPAPLPTAFTKRQQEVVTHPGVDDNGSRITIVAAAAELERDPEWADYEVAGMSSNQDGTFSALLRLKSE